MSDLVLDSINSFPDQSLSAWQESSVLKFPDSYRQISNILVCGMGGSRFTPLTIKHLFSQEIKLPYEIIDDYFLPNYAHEHSLVVLSSYSGTTEEVISCANQAKARNCRIVQVSTKPIIDVPGYIFDPTQFNPSQQPRLGNGYLLFAHLGLLYSLNLIDLNPKQILNSIQFARKISLTRTLTTQAKNLAKQLKDSYPFIVCAEFLKGFANGFANQLNENSKMISDFHYLSELNHHLLEGLSRPETLQQNGLFIFFNSYFYSPQIRKRLFLTQEVVSKQKIKTIIISLAGPDKLSQVLEAFLISGLTTYYLAKIYGVDPINIPWVNFFKSKLSSLVKS